MRFRNAIIISLLLALATISFAGWERTYGGALSDRASSIIRTSDGAYLIAGKTDSFGYGEDWVPDLYIVKIDHNGDTLWTRFYGGSQHDEAYSVVETEDSSIFVAGVTYSYDSRLGDFWLLKIDPATGDTAWTRKYGGIDTDWCYDMIKTRDNCLLLIGDTQSFGAGGGGDLYIVKTDLSGDTLWTKRYGTSEFLERGQSVIQLEDGSFIVSSVHWMTTTNDENIWLLKLNESGDTLWTKIYGGSYSDWGSSLLATGDDGFILTGAYGIALYDFNLWVMRFDTYGDTLWTKQYRSDGNETSGSYIAPTEDGGFIAIGSIGGGYSGWADIFLLKLDSEGDTLWTTIYGGSDYDFGNSVIQTPDGGYLLLCDSDSYGAGNYDIYIIKTDSLGHSPVMEKQALPMVNKISAYPNPFNSAITISLSGGVGASDARSGQVGIEIYDISGRLVADLPVTNCGEPQFVPTPQIWQPDKSISSGIYLIRARAGNNKITKPIVYLK